jgi:RNA polymerase sigma factor (sigma-70 family)
MRTGERASGAAALALRHLRRVAARQGNATLHDGQLLEGYAGQHDETAFAALVERHGPMVLGVCRRLLDHRQDAEDAFQATFLILARKAGSIRQQDSVGSWLYGVAYRVAQRARQQRAQRRRRETQGAAVAQSDPTDDLTWRELRGVLDEELNRLPDRFRSPLVLCYLEGQTQDAAAQHLTWSKGTLRRRLEQGLGLLRGRLGRRGLALSAGSLALALTQRTEAAVPGELAAATVRGALLAGSAAGAVSGAVSASVTRLVEGGLRALIGTKLKLVGVALLTVGLLVAGATALTATTGSQGQAGEDPRQQPAVTDPGARVLPFEQGAPSGLGSSRDEDREPLPAGAMVRLGGAPRGLGGGCSCLAFGPDGRTLIAACVDGTVRVLPLSGGEGVRVLGRPPGDANLNPGWVSCLAVAPDGRTLAELKMGQGVVLWDVEASRELGRLDVDLQAAPACLAFAPNGKTLATGGQAAPARLWDVSTLRELRRFDGHEGGTPAVAFSPDGKRLATGGSDHAVRIWEAGTGKPLLKLEGHRNAVHALAFAPDGKTLASLAADTTLRLWDANSGRELHRLDVGRGQELFAVGVFLRFAADGRTVAVGRADRTIRFWDVASGKALPRFQLGDETPALVALAPDGKTVAVADGEGRIRFVDRTLGEEAAGVGERQTIKAVAFAPGGKVLATAGADRTVRLWEPDTGKELRQLEGHLGEVTVLAFAPDGKLLASASADPTDRVISLWDPATGREVRRLRPGKAALTREGASGCASGFRFLTFSSDGKVVAAVTLDGALHRWEADTGTSLPGPRTGVLAVSADVGEVVGAGPDGQLRVQDVETGEAVRKFAGAPASPLGMSFSPDGRTLAAVDHDGTVSWWDTLTGGPLKATGEPQGQAPAGVKAAPPARRGGITLSFGCPPPTALAFAPDGRTLALARPDNSVELLEVGTGKSRAKLTGHRAAVLAVAFSDDGRRLATAGADTTALVWDLTQAGLPPEQLKRE